MGLWFFCKLLFRTGSNNFRSISPLNWNVGFKVFCYFCSGMGAIILIQFLFIS